MFFVIAHAHWEQAQILEHMGTNTHHIFVCARARVCLSTCTHLLLTELNIHPFHLQFQYLLLSFMLEKYMRKLECTDWQCHTARVFYYCGGIIQMTSARQRQVHVFCDSRDRQAGLGKKRLITVTLDRSCLKLIVRLAYICLKHFYDYALQGAAARNISQTKDESGS